jgi:hypothetical protein
MSIAEFQLFVKKGRNSGAEEGTRLTSSGFPWPNGTPPIFNENPYLAQI